MNPKCISVFLFLWSLSSFAQRPDFLQVSSFLSQLESEIDQALSIETLSDQEWLSKRFSDSTPSDLERIFLGWEVMEAHINQTYIPSFTFENRPEGLRLLFFDSACVHHRLTPVRCVDFVRAILDYGIFQKQMRNLDPEMLEEITDSDPPLKSMQLDALSSCLHGSYIVNAIQNEIIFWASPGDQALKKYLRQRIGRKEQNKKHKRQAYQQQLVQTFTRATKLLHQYMYSISHKSVGCAQSQIGTKYFRDPVVNAWKILRVSGLTVPTSPPSETEIKD